MELNCTYDTEQGKLHMRMPVSLTSSSVQHQIEMAVTNGRGYDPFMHSVLVHREQTNSQKVLDAVLDFMNITSRWNAVEEAQ